MNARWAPLTACLAALGGVRSFSYLLTGTSIVIDEMTGWMLPGRIQRLARRRRSSAHGGWEKRTPNYCGVVFARS
jgi:hypothetical protein